MTDRWYGANEGTFRGRQIILVIPMGASDATPAQHILGMFETSLGKKRIFATILAPGAHGKGVVRKHKEVLAKARYAGQRVVEIIGSAKSAEPAPAHPKNHRGEKAGGDE